jgi:D-glycero-alpha-D-manno-heptose-7-phosphate kinase
MVRPTSLSASILATLGHLGHGARVSATSVRRVIEASAPTRIDLAGGTLDIWPIYLYHPGAATVNVAIDRRAWCRVETGVNGVRIHSRDTRQTVEAAEVTELLGQGPASLVAQILTALGVESGVSVTTHSTVPAGSGLGGSSALAIAAAAAVGRAFEREVGDLWPLVRDAEARCIGVPTGVQDYHPAILGGVLGLQLEPGAIRVDRLPVDPGRIEESLMLVDAGATRFSGLNNWQVFKGQIDGDAAVMQGLAAIAGAAARLRLALLEGRYEDVAELVTEEWEARKRLAPGVTTPEIDTIVDLARSAGGAAKVCGAGGGGIVAVWATPGARGSGTRERVREALKGTSFAEQRFRVDLRGLEVERIE